MSVDDARATRPQTQTRKRDKGKLTSDLSSRGSEDDGADGLLDALVWFGRVPAWVVEQRKPRKEELCVKLAMIMRWRVEQERKRQHTHCEELKQFDHNLIPDDDLNPDTCRLDPVHQGFASVNFSTL